MNAEACIKLANAYLSVGKTQKAEETFLAACEIIHKFFGPTCPRFARALHGLGMAMMSNDKRIGEAQRTLEVALEIRRQAHGDHHVDVAATLNDIAIAMAKQGDLIGALSTYEATLSIRARLFGEDHSSVADLHICIARLHLARGDTGKALAHIDAASSIKLGRDIKIASSFFDFRITNTAAAA